MVEHPMVARFRAEHARLGGTGEIVILPDAVHTAALAAEALGCEPGAIANVRETRISVPAEIALEDPPVLGPIEHRAPRLELTHPGRRLLRVAVLMPVMMLRCRRIVIATAGFVMRGFRIRCHRRLLLGAELR